MSKEGNYEKVKEIVIPFMKEMNTKMPDSKVVISVFSKGEETVEGEEQGISIACEIFSDVGPEHLEYLMANALKSVQGADPAEIVYREKKE